jgi:hypothetical protein
MGQSMTAARGEEFKPALRGVGSELANFCIVNPSSNKICSQNAQTIGQEKKENAWHQIAKKLPALHLLQVQSL